MKDLIVRNISAIKGTAIERDGNQFTIKPVVAGNQIDTCEVSIVEIPAGNRAFEYHFHDQREEVFYIISGTGRLRCYDGEKEVRAGDVLCFPTGEKGAHEITNMSETEPLVFIDFDVRASKTDVVTFPDRDTVWVMGEHVDGVMEVSQPKTFLLRDWLNNA
jgi:uncharacterized cupin superfamily protein